MVAPSSLAWLAFKTLDVAGISTSLTLLPRPEMCVSKIAISEG